RSTRSRGRDEPHREALIERQGDERRLAVARHPRDADALRVDRFDGLEVVERARCSPSPRSKRAPLIGLSRLAEVREPDDAARQPGARRLRILIGSGAEAPRLPAAGVILNRRRIERRAPPPGCDEEVALVGWARTVAARPETAKARSLHLERRPAEAHEHRHRRARLLRQGQGHRDLDFDLGTGRVVDDADDLVLYRRLAAGLHLAALLELPPNLGDAVGNATVHLAFEELDDLRA